MPISTVNQAGLNAPLTLTSPVLTTPNLGTPSALVLTNATGTPAAINLSNATALPSNALPSGVIKQVVVAQINARYSVSASSFTGLGPTLSITPSSSSSRIFLLAPISIQLNQYTFWTFLRNGTNVCGASQGIFTNSNTSATNNSWFNTCIGYVDSPSTSSAISYQIGVYANSSSVVYLNDYSNGNNCQLIAMEIA